MSFLFFFDTLGAAHHWFLHCLPLLDNAACQAFRKGIMARSSGAAAALHVRSDKANTSWSDQCITKSAKPAPVWVDAQDLVVREIRVSAEADRVVARFDIMGVDSLSLHPNSVTFLRFSTLASDFPAKIHTKSVNTIGDFTEGRELDHIDDWLPLHDCLG